MVFNNLYVGGGADYDCNKIALLNGLNTPTTTSIFGFGVSPAQLDYFSNNHHVFYTGTTGGTGYGTERLRITSTGNVGIGTATPGYRLEVGTGYNTITMTATYLNIDGTSIRIGGNYQNICAKFNGGTWMTDYVVTSSDSRIK